MQIERVERHSAQELIERLRKVTMLTNPGVFPYKDVFISLEKLSTSYLMPPQRYVLSSELLKVRALSWALREHSVDIFNLDGFVRIWFSKDIEDPIDLLPPVVEESIEDNGAVVNLINDGMHRVYMARLEWKIPQVIFIRGIPKDLPYYAYPVPGGWDNIAEVEELPDGYIKKWHRIKEYKSLYRNFNSAFDNVGAPRGTFKK